MGGSSDSASCAFSAAVERGQKELEDHLRGISSKPLNSASLKESVDFFCDLYKPDALYGEGEKGFRHNYAGVSLIVCGGDLPQGLREVQNAVRTAQMISSNLDQIGMAIDMSDCDMRIKKCVRKLRDHVGLEMQRMSVFESVYVGIDNTRDDLASSFKAMVGEEHAKFEDGIKSATTAFYQNTDVKIRDVQEKLQRNYISILGIFAAIVIAFMAGTAFSSSVLQNIDKASIYRISFVVLLVGFFIFNLVCALFVFLNRISDIDNKPVKWLVVVVDVVFVILLACVIAARMFDVLSLFPALIP